MSSYNHNQKAESTLAASLSGGRLSHAILVEGTGGALDFAKKIARAVLCEAQAKPCDACKHCAKVSKDIHPDLIMYTGYDRAKSFHVEQVREIKSEAYISPNEADSKVFILENVQNMSVKAQNALLKIIEEPPANVSFILTCENKSALLETILSRVTTFTLDDAGDTADTEAKALARAIVDDLLAGKELAVLHKLAPFEKMRPELAALFKMIRDDASARLIGDAKENANNRDRYKKLSKIVDTTDNLEAGVAQNVSGLLLTSMLSANFKL